MLQADDAGVLAMCTLVNIQEPSLLRIKLSNAALAVLPNMSSLRRLVLGYQGCLFSRAGAGAEERKKATALSLNLSRT